MNKYRNESTIEINGTEYTLRPTFHAIASIETALTRNYGKKVSIISLLSTLETDALSFYEVYVIVEQLLKASGEKVSKSELEEAIAEDFQYFFDRVVTVVLPSMVLGGKKYSEIHQEAEGDSQEQVDPEKK